MNPVNEILLGGLKFLVLAVLYFIPSFVGRKKRAANSISLFNFFFGWTGIGWIACLIWAATPDNKAAR